MDVNKVCRCCLSVESHKDIFAEYTSRGKVEIYSEMLFNTFNIKIPKYNRKHMICEQCVQSLRDAAIFKKKVEDSCRTLSKLMATKDNPDILKGFVDYYDADGFDDFDDSVDADFVWDTSKNGDEGQIFVINVRSKPDVEPVKTPRDTEKAPVKVAKGPKKKTKPATRRKPENPAPEDVELDDISGAHCPPENPSTTQSQIASRKNSLQLILNSNICLFRSLKTKFGCFFCKQSYMTVQELREHSRTHSNVKVLKHRFNLLTGLSYKSVDITDLACKVCWQRCEDLNDLILHLKTHDVDFKGAEHFLIPYKLGDGFKCVICSKEFNTFARLAIHMNTHSTNNVCEICGISYINRLSLRTHVASVHREKKCSKCLATFSTHYSRVKHMKKVHNVGSYKRYCLICGKTFRYTYLLNEHKIRDHGAKRKTTSCEECGKTFLTAQNLKVHMRFVHIKERRYPCTVCGMRFITRYDQKRHETSHEDVRSFSCNHCDGRFKSKDSWRRHLKRQHGQLYEVK